MFLTRWNKTETPAWPNFGRLSDLREELDRLFESPFGELGRAGRLLNGWAPAVDLYEDKDSFTVKAELPGLKREDIDVSLNDGTLVISGERKTEQKFDEAETHRVERYYGRFQRSIALPASVKADQIAAQYKDGILTVTLPKSEEAKPKQIEINVK
jgi:HSP20 family protein